MTRQKKSIYVCQKCGYQVPKWLGRCPECGQWDSMIEEVQGPPREKKWWAAAVKPEKIGAISLEPDMRLLTGLGEFDRTLGGGIVPGSVVLIGGDPGIGKSTLVLQVLDRLSSSGLKSLYLSGEESAQQIKLRAERLGACSENLFILNTTCLDDILAAVDSLGPELLAVDSIQTVYTSTLSSAPGSVGQVREVAARLMTMSKESGIPVFMVGHVTKEGSIAGPKVLEHLVDTVLYFEGDTGHLFRILRAVKNRYGSTNEIGVFEMKDTGLGEVGNPSRIFLEERREGAPGSVVIPCIEGTRPVLVELQALVGPTPLGTPRRTSIGVDHNRISLLVAVLGKRVGLELGDHDIFVNVAGGLRVEEPAADMGIISAMMSSFLGRPVDKELVVFGEVGLAGEIRGVSQPELRIREAKKLGFSRCLLSKSNMEGLDTSLEMKISAMGTIQDLYEELFHSSP